ncbi:amidohydrolase [Gemmatimonadetes bacterium T265]|nr:amidohydrolase [Gemmatimonadetes bacterium T265]
MLLLAGATSASAQTPTSAPDLILRHGHIYTGDPAHPWVEAVSIRGDRVLAAGSDSAIDATADAHTRVIDLRGRMAMPGINDAHDHVGGAPYGVEARTSRPPMADPPLQDVSEAVRGAAAGAGAAAWIQASVGVTVIRHPTEARAAMDRAGGGHPVLLYAWWGHGVILNTPALAALGLDDGVQDPQGGRFDRDPQGHLTGLAEEYAGSAIRRRLGTAAGVPASVANLWAYAQRRLAEGVTTVQIMGTSATPSAYRQTLVQADVPLRLRLMRVPMPDEDARAGERDGRGEESLTPRARIAGVKWILDGTPLEELAYLTTDYPDRAGWRGRPNFGRDFLDRQFRTALRGDDQLMLHIVGDAMTDEVLDEMEQLAPAERWRPLRVRFEHGDGLTTPARDARARALGVVIAQPRPGRPFRTLLADGIPLAYGSDGGMAPFFMFARMTDPHDPQAITREQALGVLTSGPSFAEFQERSKGTLAPGMLADLAVLSQDAMTTPTDALPGTRSLLTIVGGRVAFAAPEFTAGRGTP